MKPIHTLVWVYFLLLLDVDCANAQDNIALLRNLRFPQNIEVEIKKDTSFLKDYNRNLIAIANVKLGHTSVNYRILKYSAVDSLLFENAESSYWMKSNCNSERNVDQRKELRSFIKNGFFFLLPLCPCNTVKHTECSDLALIMNNWIKEK